MRFASSLALVATERPHGSEGLATEIDIGIPADIAADAVGNLVLPAFNDEIIRYLDIETGQLTNIAGNYEESGYSACDETRLTTNTTSACAQVCDEPNHDPSLLRDARNARFFTLRAAILTRKPIVVTDNGNGVVRRATPTRRKTSWALRPSLATASKPSPSPQRRLVFEVVHAVEGHRSLFRSTCFKTSRLVCKSSTFCSWVPTRRTFTLEATICSRSLRAIGRKGTLADNPVNWPDFPNRRPSPATGNAFLSLTPATTASA